MHLEDINVIQVRLTAHVDYSRIHAATIFLSVRVSQPVNKIVRTYIWSARQIKCHFVYFAAQELTIILNPDSVLMLEVREQVVINFMKMW